MLKKLLPLTTLLLLNALCLCPQLSFANEGGIPIGHLRLSQERFEKNGVLISRPAAIDEKILAIIRQNQFQSVEDYAAWLQKNMVYKSAAEQDQWSEPGEFLNTRQGDCKDFASLNSRVLHILGYQPRVLALTSSNAGHAVCAFEYAGKIYWLDNAQLKTSNATNFLELARELTGRFHYTRSFEVDLPTKRTSLIYERS